MASKDTRPYVSQEKIHRTFVYFSMFILVATMILSSFVALVLGKHRRPADSFSAEEVNAILQITTPVLLVNALLIIIMGLASKCLFRASEKRDLAIEQEIDSIRSTLNYFSLRIAKGTKKEISEELMDLLKVFGSNLDDTVTLSLRIKAIADVLGRKLESDSSAQNTSSGGSSSQNKPASKQTTDNPPDDKPASKPAVDNPPNDKPASKPAADNPPDDKLASKPATGSQDTAVEAADLVIPKMDICLEEFKANLSEAKVMVKFIPPEFKELKRSLESLNKIHSEVMKAQKGAGKEAHEEAKEQPTSTCAETEPNVCCTQTSSDPQTEFPVDTLETKETGM